MRASWVASWHAKSDALIGELFVHQSREEVVAAALEYVEIFLQAILDSVHQPRQSPV